MTSQRFSNNWGTVRASMGDSLGYGLAVTVPGRPGQRLKPMLLGAGYAVMNGPQAGTLAGTFPGGQGRIILYQGTLDVNLAAQSVPPLFSTPALNSTGIQVGQTPDAPFGTELMQCPLIHIDKLLLDMLFTLAQGFLLTLPEIDELMTPAGGGLVAILTPPHDALGNDPSLVGGVVGSLTLWGTQIDASAPMAKPLRVR